MRNFLWRCGFQFYPGKRLPVVCRDGITRTAVATGYAGHGLPAAVQVTFAGKRRTVSGTVYPLPFSRLLSFYATGRNSDLIGWTSHKPRLAAAALRLIKATAYGHGAPGYIWDYAGDHAAALAAGCRHYYGTGQWPAGGCAARAVLKRLPPDVLPRLAVYFTKLAALYMLHDPINGERLTPPPPPPPPPA
jgi:hypothetical protein